MSLLYVDYKVEKICQVSQFSMSQYSYLSTQIHNVTPIFSKGLVGVHETLHLHARHLGDFYNYLKVEKKMSFNWLVSIPQQKLKALYVQRTLLELAYRTLVRKSILRTKNLVPQKLSSENLKQQSRTKEFSHRQLRAKQAIEHRQDYLHFEMATETNHLLPYSK